MDYSTLSTDRIKTILNQSVAELSKKLEQPIYNIYPEEGPYRAELYPKHMEAIRATETHDIVYFRAANRIGKTLTAALCAARWLTGIYPANWQGRKFDHPTRGWCVGVDHQQLREAMQKILLEEALSSNDGGFIPSELIYKRTHKQKPPGAVMDLEVIHYPSYQKLNDEQKKNPAEIEKCLSKATFKACEQKIENFGGAKLDWATIDEEPPLAYFSEIKMRTASGKIDGRPGVVFIAATPLKCYSPFVRMFDTVNDDVTKATKKCIVATWDDVPHMSTEEKRRLLEDMPPHEVEARTKGIPYLGGGMTFPVSPDRYVVDHIDPMFPDYYRHVNGIDHGSVTAVVFMAKDPLTEKIYVWNELEFKDTAIPVIAHALSGISKYVYASDTSINGVNPFDQKQLNAEYDNCGLIFKYPNKKLKQSIVSKVVIFMISGQLQISKHCKKLLAAILSSYRGDDGRIVKKDDDHHLDAFLYAFQLIDQFGMTKKENTQFLMDIHAAQLEYNMHNRDWESGGSNGWV